MCVCTPVRAHTGEVRVYTAVQAPGREVCVHHRVSAWGEVCVCTTLRVHGEVCVGTTLRAHRGEEAAG